MLQVVVPYDLRWAILCKKRFPFIGNVTNLQLLSKVEQNYSTKRMILAMSGNSTTTNFYVHQCVKQVP